MADGKKLFAVRAGWWRYVLLAAAAGLTLLLWPSGGGDVQPSGGGDVQPSGGGQDAEEARLSSLLEAMEGVGRAEVLLSESGAAVVCQGADSVTVRLNVTEAMRCYTGLGADRIVIFKMNESWREQS